MNEEYYKYIKKWFKRWAPVYDSVEIFISGVRNKVVNFANAKSSSKILDVATGTGRQAQAFARNGYDVVGVDLSEDMLRVANKHNKNKRLEFKIADATNLPFENDWFDVSCIAFALHDMPLLIRTQVLKEMVRVTKPRGNILIVDYVLPQNRIRRFLTYYFVKLYESKYYSEFVKADLETLLKESGICIQEEFSVLFGAARILKGIKNG